MIAITMNDDAFFAHRPRPKIPSAKIVGNMIDMKKYVRNTHATDTQPSLAKINRQRAGAAVQYQPSTLYGVNFFRMALPVNRPIRKQRKPSEARFDAALLLKPSTPFECISNQSGRPLAHDAGTGGTCEVM